MLPITQNSKLAEVRIQLREFVEKLHTAGLLGHISQRLEEIDAQLTEDRIPLMTIQLHQVANPAMFIEEARSIRKKSNGSVWLTRLEYARNVFILLPLGLTWLALWQAFQAFLRSGERGMDQFLWNWLNGFEKSLPAIFTFSEVARYDFFLIMSIIGLTIAVQYLHNRFEEKSDAEIMSLATELDTLLWRLTQAMKVDALVDNSDSEIRTLQIMNTIGEFVGEFQQQGEARLNLLAGEQEHLESLAKLRNDEINSLQSLSKDFQAQFSSYEKIIQELTRNINRLAKLAERSLDQNGQSQSNQEKLFRSLQGLEGQFSRFESVTIQLSQNLQSSADQMGYALSQNAADMQGFTQIVSGLQKSVNALAQNQKNAQDVIFQNQKELQDVILQNQKELQESLSKSMTQFMEDFENNQQHFQASMREQNTASVRLMQTVNDQVAKINSAQTQLINALQRMEQQFGSFERVAQELSRSMSASTASLDAVNAQNRLATEKFNQVVSTVQEMSNQQMASHRTIAQTQEASSQRIEALVRHQNEVQKEIQTTLCGAMRELGQNFDQSLQKNMEAMQPVTELPASLDEFNQSIGELKLAIVEVAKVVKHTAAKPENEPPEPMKEKEQGIGNLFRFLRSK